MKVDTVKISTDSILNDNTPRYYNAKSEYLDVCDDGVYREERVYGNLYKRQLVMDKETFRECYKRWILEGEESNDENERASDM